MANLVVSNFAQIEKAEISFGDLTVFVGPQATGKSILLQLLKFAVDSPVIARDLKTNGLEWNKGQKSGLLAAYMGEGYEKSFHPDTAITFNSRSLLRPVQRIHSRKARVLYVPAQRVVTMADGWPRPFNGFEPGDPYVVRQFSQEVLEQFGRGLGGKSGQLFPQPDRLRAHVRNAIEQSIFHGGRLVMHSEGRRRRMMLNYPSPRDLSTVQLPFFEWSAGQREFAPLLLGLYQLLPSGGVRSQDGYQWAIVEEPEMGLHPQGINAVMLLVFELIDRGYRVCLSTHSTYVLELIWALQILKSQSDPKRARKAVADALHISGQAAHGLAGNLLKKKIKAYALKFDEHGKHICQDISAMNVEDANPIVAGWGGVTDLSVLVSEAVAWGL